MVRLREADEELSPQWARFLVPPPKPEYELVYHGKERKDYISACPAPRSHL